MLGTLAVLVKDIARARAADIWGHEGAVVDAGSHLRAASALVVWVPLAPWHGVVTLGTIQCPCFRIDRAIVMGIRSWTLQARPLLTTVVGICVVAGSSVLWASWNGPGGRHD